MTRRPLTRKERVVIYGMHKSGYGIREIGRAINRCHSIVSREVRRNRPPARLLRLYNGLGVEHRAEYAHRTAQHKLSSRRRGIRKCSYKNTRIGNYVVHLLREERQSPEQASATLDKLYMIKVSTSTIYRMVNQDLPYLKESLPHRGKKKRRRITGRRQKLSEGAKPKKSISERPVAASERLETGHLEMDTIHNTRSGDGGGILTLVDRVSRTKHALLLPDLTACTTRRVLVRYLHTLPPEDRRSISTDNGGEFQEWPAIEGVFPGLGIYFCAPYASYQKGSIERANLDYRRFLPKGTNLSLLKQRDLDRITETINNYPLKILNKQTPIEFHASQTS